jgi:CMP/dCMP kinase
VYLVASAEVRAARRAAEGVAGVDGAAVAADLARRDRLDSSRADSPLATAEDALTIDTSDLDVDGVVARILRALEERR